MVEMKEVKLKRERKREKRSTGFQIRVSTLCLIRQAVFI